MRQPHYPPVSGLCRRWLPTIRIQQGFTTGEMGFRVSLHSSNPEPLISALGHQLPRDLFRVASALPPITDTKVDGRRVRFGPCVDGSELARTFFTNAALVGAAMCSAC
jgi:hypothetical protein